MCRGGSWLKDVPRKGRVELFFCREPQTIEEEAVKALKTAPNSVCSTVTCPRGVAWVHAVKCQRLRNQLVGRFILVERCFKWLDEEATGSFTRPQLAAGLYRVSAPSLVLASPCRLACSR